MPRLSLFSAVTAVAAVAGLAVVVLALNGDTAAALALTGVTLTVGAVAQLLATRRTVHETRSALRTVAEEVAALRKVSATLGDELTVRSEAYGTGLADLGERVRRQVDGAERRILASVDAARLEAAGRHVEMPRPEEERVEVDRAS